ncbi:MAG: V-type ATPase subunit [Clostridiales bacterium]|nr:V-type ATPase subunit [Candidatus Scatonaster coprocaballi]
MSQSISKYAYSVSGAHVYEKSFLRKSDIDKLLTAPSYEAAVAVLSEHGWTMPDDSRDIGKILDLEMTRAWSWILESAPDPTLFDCLIRKNDYHNLKAGIKSLLSDFDVDLHFISPSTLDQTLLKEAIETNHFDMLPSPFAKLAEEVYDVLVRTQDGQAADVMVDRKCLDEIQMMAAKTKIPLLIEEMELYTATTNIKTAFRAIRTGKDSSWVEKALTDRCTTVSREKLISFAGGKVDDLLNYLATTPYSAGTKFLSSSPSEFEKWVDDEMVARLLSTKNSPLGPEPLIGFYLGKEAEVKNARIILSAKQNNLPIEMVASRVRRLYE